jgi:hypothetical protein
MAIRIAKSITRGCFLRIYNFHSSLCEIRRIFKKNFCANTKEEKMTKGHFNIFNLFHSGITGAVLSVFTFQINTLLQLQTFFSGQ